MHSGMGSRRHRLAVSAAIAAALLGATAAAASAPALRLADRSPFVVTGSGFPAGAKVAVVATRHGTVHVVAGRAGAFRARFPGAGISRCDTLVVTATAAKARAVLKIPRPACSPAREPTPQPPPYRPPSA
jgi:hypothetical protein